MQTTETLLLKRASKSLGNKYFRHRNDGVIITRNQECFMLYKKKFCWDDATPEYFIDDVYEIDDMYFLVKMVGEKKVIQDITTMIETMQHIMWYSFWIFLLYLILAYPLGLLFLKTIYKKLYQASKHLERDEVIDIASMHLAPHDEIRLLFEKINTSMESIKQFNSYVSHEMKTPLMILHSHIDVMQVALEQQSYDTLKTKIPQMKKNINDIADIIDVLGKFMVIENKSYDGKYETVSCCTTLRSLIPSYEQQRDDRTYVFDIACEGTLYTNPVLFTLLLRNLLDNAVKYSIKGADSSKAKIFVSLNERHLIIKNPAKKPQNVEALSEKFYKEGNESGLGLGLYLVRKIVVLLGWEMDITYGEGMFVVEVKF